MAPENITVGDLRTVTNVLLDKLAVFQELVPKGEPQEESIGILLNEPLGLIEYVVALAVVNTFRKGEHRMNALEPFVTKLCELLETTPEDLDIVDMYDFIGQMDEVISDRLKQLREKIN